MSDAVTIALINNLPGIITAVGSVVGAVGAICAVIISRGNSREIIEVKKNTNGLVDDKVKNAIKEAKEEVHEEYRRSGFAKLTDGTID